MQAPRFSPLKLGIFFGILAVGMLVTELVYKPIFTLQLTESIALPVWILVGVYAGLQLLLWHMTKRHLDLTGEELAKWGEQLEAVTPEILDLYAQHVPLREIATRIHTSHGIPPDVTLRYIIALGKHAKESGSAS